MTGEKDAAADLAAKKRALFARLVRERGIDTRPGDAIQRRPEGAEPPLSFAQRRLWFLDQLEPESPRYNIVAALRLEGTLHLFALSQALEEIVRRHEALRARFVDEGGEPALRLRPAAPVPLEVVDLGGTAESEQAGEVERLAGAEARRPFRLSEGPLFRAGLVRLGEGSHVLLLAVHHIVSDGWSMEVLTRELWALYEAFREGRPSPLPELRVQYADFAAWQREWLQGSVLEDQLSYWRRQLQGLGTLEFPTDRARPAVQRFEGALRTRTLPAGLLEQVRGLSQREGVTPFMTLLSAFAVLLHRHSGQDDIGIGAPVANRTRAEVEGLIGFFANMLVLRADMSADPTFLDLLGRVREVALGAYAHQDLPFERLVEELNPERHLSRSPLFQVAFVLQRPLQDGIRLPGLTVTPAGVDSRVSKFDLTLYVNDGEPGSIAIEYSTDLFEADTIDRMLGHLQILVEGVVADPSRRLSELPLLTSSEERRLVVEWNATDTEYPSRSSVAQVFAAQAERTPEATAVAAGSEVLSYRELDARARRLAGHLRGLGVGPESRVALCAERSLDMVVALLAIMKAGGAYVPLDASYPKERLAFMLQDSRATVLLTEERMLDALPEHRARVVCLDRDRDAIARASDAPFESGAFPESLAYVTYTSGSTGIPKGVEVRQRGVLRLVFGVDYARFGPGETFLQLAPVSFDASTLEVWGALLHGGKCVLYPERVPTARELADVIAAGGVTTLWLTASLYNAMVDESPEALSGVKQLLIGGEALSVSHVRRGLRSLPETRIINGYGPTESTTFTCCHPIPRDLPADVASIPIGRPIGNTRVYVLDAGMRPVPVGVAGELYIGGDGLARGYLGRPELTAERFVPDPFDGTGGGRLYRTGDLVRRLADGAIEFRGRIDHQVKVRGYRIELGEIEAALQQHPSVKETVVLVREDQPGDKRIVAYVIPRGEALDVGALRGHLQARLPEYMVPSAFVRLTELPLSPNGKVDRRALPGPEGRADMGETFEAPASEIETRIAEVWKDVLRLDRVGVKDNFFDLGGHSLLLLQVHRRLREELGRPDLSVVELFRNPTVQSLAAQISGGAAASGERAAERARRRREARTHDVAIVGMAGRFPGARDLEEFWSNLRAGVESISFFSDDEVEKAGVPPALWRDDRYVKARGVLRDVELFDAAFFGYNPREAEVMDPQQRVFLETAWEALERAGYDAETYAGLVGVYAGVGTNTYWRNLGANPEALAAVGGFAALLGSDKDFLSTRVSYKLDLRGPSVAVQTACSTSLVAVHLACQSLLAQECDMALAGGVSVLLPQQAGYRYEPQGIGSPDGHCRAFDAKAQGTVTGNGVGVVVLKRLADALRDGDTVEAVIKGSAINNDGSNKVGYTAPGVAGQAEAIAVAQMVGEVAPETIGYVEAHGTATTLGDPIEIEALKHVFRGRAGKRSCAIGSVKTNVGHLDAAAGVAGLVKTVLSLKHREIPPSLHYQAPNPKIDFEDSPFFVNDRLRPWEGHGGPRRAGVSSFGIGGTNAHVVLEEAPEREPSDPSRPWQLLVLSAKTASAATQARARLAAHLEAHPEQELADVAWTLQAGRRPFRHRTAVVCRDADDARAVLAGADPRRVLEAVVEDSGGRGVAFLFPGQGAQHAGMCAGLYAREAVFRDEVDRCAAHLREQLGFELRDVLFPEEGSAAEAAARLDETATTQPALFTVEYALARLWMSWGVKPQAMLGHSVGEYVAACLAGVFSLEDAASLVAARGQSMQGLPKGAMLAVSRPAADVAALLDASLALAATNAPAQCVVSGPPEAVEALEARLVASGVECQRLRTSHAFHSPMMEPILSRFRSLVAGVERRAPRIPYVSNVTGTWITGEQATDPGYWARHLRETVRFSEGVGALLERSPRVLLEVGPGHVLGALARQQLEKGTQVAVVASARHPRESRPDEEALLGAAGRVWLAGVDVDWTALHAGERRRRVPLPTYPFERQRYWLEASPASLDRAAAAPRGRRSLSDWFYVPAWFRAPAPRFADTATARGSWLVFADESGLGEALARRFEEMGDTVVRVEAAASYERRGEDRYGIEPGRREDYDALVADLRARGARPTRVVHAWGVTAGEPSPSERPVAMAQDRGFYSLLFLTQALGTNAGTPVDVAVLTSHVQDVLGTEDLRPEKATVLGACRVIPQERPSTRVRSIDVEAPGSQGWPERLLDQLSNEVRSDSADFTVAYRQHRRWVQAFEPVSLPAPEGPPPRLREGGVYLVTGGLGGVGLELAAFLARSVKARLVLVGRSAFPPAADWSRRLETLDAQDHEARRIRKVQSLVEAGAEVLVLQADVADPAEMRAVVARAREEFGALHGVIHAAGAPKRQQPVEEADRVHAEEQFRPRLGGLLALESALRGTALDFCIVHSSLASVIGAVGFVAYAAAHAFMDRFAALQARSGVPWIAVDWDNWQTWSTGGPDGAGSGELVMTASEGVDAFARVLGLVDAPSVVVSTGDLQARIDRWVRLSFLGTPEKSAAAATSRHPRPGLPTPYVAPRSEAESALAEIWQDLLGIDRIGVEDDFFALGGDSVVGIQVLARSTAAGLQLTARQIFERPTIAQLAAVAGKTGTGVVEEESAPGEPVPLTPIQRWFFEQRLAAPHHFNQSVLLEVRGPLEPAVIERAVDEVMRRHDALRFRFREEGAAVVAVPMDVPGPVFTRVDLVEAPGAEQASVLETEAGTLQASLDLSHGPLMRASYFHRGERRSGLLLLVVHHLVVDVISWRVLLEDLETACRQLAAGEAVRLPPRTTSFARWARELARVARSETVASESAYWLSRPWERVVPLPRDLADGENTVASARVVATVLEADDTRALLQDVPDRLKAQTSEVLLTALAASMRRWTGAPVFQVDLEGHGREPVADGVNVSRTVGWFTSLFPVVIDLGADSGLLAALKSVKQQFRAIPGHGLGYGLLRYLGGDEAVSRRLAELPPAGASLLYLGRVDPTAADGLFAPSAEPVGAAREPRQRRPHPLEVVASVTGGRLRVNWIYSENLHHRSTVEALAEGFLDSLRALVRMPAEAEAHTASDFPAARLGQQELEAFLSTMRRPEGAGSR